MAATFTMPSMPGSFTFDYDANRVDVPTARPPFFIPPSPSASSLISRSSHWQCKDARKRPRTPGAPRPTISTTGSYSLDAPSPAPLVNTEYVFAGGTPSTSHYHTDDQHALEQDFRPNRYSKPSEQITAQTHPHTPQPEHGSKRRRLSGQQTGWGRTVWDLTGGVAGKAINFCWTVAFNGFHAGSGRGYDMEVETPVVVAGDPADIPPGRDVFDSNYRDINRTPIPGDFPMSKTHAGQIREQSWEEISTPTAKSSWDRRTTLGSNWVVVDAPAMKHEDASPARKRSRPSTANLYAKSASKPQSSRPRLPARHSASFASTRASHGGRTSLPPSASPALARPGSSESDHQRQHKRNRSSIASPRISEATSTTPKSPDVIKFEKKIQKQNRRQADSINWMGQQLQDMIREGQQALGSRIEIFDGDEDDDEGYRSKS